MQVSISPSSAWTIAFFPCPVKCPMYENIEVLSSNVMFWDSQRLCSTPIVGLFNIEKLYNI